MDLELLAVVDEENPQLIGVQIPSTETSLVLQELINKNRMERYMAPMPLGDCWKVIRLR